MVIEENRFEIASSSSSSATTAKLDFKGHTLIIPCVSIGSIPQLAVDVLLEPRNAVQVFGEKGQFVATLDHRFCVPFLGGVSIQDDRDGIDPIQGPLRLYHFSTKKMTILQQRSPIIKSRKRDFIQALLRWIQMRQFSQVIIVTSLDAGLRTDAQMKHPFWYYSSIKDSNHQSHIYSKIKSNLHRLGRDSKEEKESSSNVPGMPSGGLAKMYLEAAQSKTCDTPFHALATFAAEGDNRSDALAMAALVADIISEETKSLRLSLYEPRDWSLLFGSQANDSMFN